MVDYLPLLPWLLAVVVAYGLRRELALRLREIARYWGLPVRRRTGAQDEAPADSREVAGDMREEELREVLTRYARAPAGTREAVRKLLAP